MPILKKSPDKKPETGKIVSYETQPERPTAVAYEYLQHAYDWFNTELWEGKLPQCLITLRATKKQMGYYCPKRFSRLQADDVTTDEIALNAQHFAAFPTEETMSTLVHEMCHLWQQHFGHMPRRGYHDKQWGREMKRIGLHPSSTGRPGGKETGQKMNDYIISGGMFESAYARWIDAEKPALYADVAMIIKAETSTSKEKSKVKYTCPGCAINAWGKPKLKIVCGECEKRMEPDDPEDDPESSPVAPPTGKPVIASA